MAERILGHPKVKPIWNSVVEEVIGDHVVTPGGEKLPNMTGVRVKNLKTGDVSDPIRTKQGFIIFKVVQHILPGVTAYKDVEQQVEEAYYESKMEPAIREYLTTMRDEAYIDIKTGFEDTGASTNKRVNPISYAAYTPPAPKKKKKSAEKACNCAPGDLMCAMKCAAS